VNRSVARCASAWIVDQRPLRSVLELPHQNGTRRPAAAAGSRQLQMPGCRGARGLAAAGPGAYGSGPRTRSAEPRAMTSRSKLAGEVKGSPTGGQRDSILAARIPLEAHHVVERAQGARTSTSTAGSALPPVPRPDGCPLRARPAGHHPLHARRRALHRRGDPRG